MEVTGCRLIAELNVVQGSAAGAVELEFRAAGADRAVHVDARSRSRFAAFTVLLSVIAA